jgi:hypothetical protein
VASSGKRHQYRRDRKKLLSGVSSILTRIASLSLHGPPFQVIGSTKSNGLGLGKYFFKRNVQLQFFRPVAITPTRGYRDDRPRSNSDLTDEGAIINWSSSFKLRYLYMYLFSGYRFPKQSSARPESRESFSSRVEYSNHGILSSSVIDQYIRVKILVIFMDWVSCAKTFWTTSHCYMIYKMLDRDILLLL